MSSKGRDWLKLWTRILHDPKINRLSEADAWRWVQCLCIAADYGALSGRLRSLSDMATMLRRSESDLKADLDRLVSAGLIDRRAGGERGVFYAIHDWQEWQSNQPVDSAPRAHAPARAHAAPPAREEIRGEEKEEERSGEETRARDPIPDHPQFADFKSCYPKRLDNHGWDHAPQLFQNLINQGANPQAIIDAAKHYHSEVIRAGNAAGDKRRYIKKPDTFLADLNFLIPAINGQPQPFKPIPDFEGALRICRNYAETGIRVWQFEWGPPPSHPNCQIPQNLLTDEDRAATWRDWKEVADELMQQRGYVH